MQCNFIYSHCSNPIEYCTMRSFHPIPTIYNLTSISNLINPRHWLHHHLALILVQRIVMIGPVLDFHCTLILVEVCQRTLHPILIVAIRMILMGMRTPRFLPCFRTVHGGRRTPQQIVQLQRFHHIRVPNQRLIRHLGDILERLYHLINLPFPSDNGSDVRYTVACSCMTSSIVLRMSAVEKSPLLYRSLSRLSKLLSMPASPGLDLTCRTTMASPGLAMSAMRRSNTVLMTSL